MAGQTEPYNWPCQSLGTNSVERFSNLFWVYKATVREKPNHANSRRNILKEIDQVLRSKELELSQVEIEVQSLRIVAELLGEEADQEEARKLAVRDQH
jgi:hypothetical protein